jgi:putative flippase GtrA
MKTMTSTASVAVPAVPAAAGEGERPAGAGGDGAAPRGPLAAFVRFVFFGGGVSLLSSGVLLLTTGRVPFAVANAVVTVVSTLVTTELHHRFTFAGGGSGAGGGGAKGRRGSAGWRIHAKSALTLVAAYLFTTAAVLLLGAVRPGAGPLLTQAVYLGASGAAGIGRFLILRLVVFARRPADGPKKAHRVRTRHLHRDRVTVAA